MIAREAEFVVVLPSQLIAVFPIIQDNLCILKIFWATGMMGIFGLVKPGKPSKIAPICPVFWDIQFINIS